LIVCHSARGTGKGDWARRNGESTECGRLKQAMNQSTTKQSLIDETIKDQPTNQSINDHSINQ
jgi:hypothetical protein